MRDPELWNRLKEIFHTARELPEGERAAYLRAACGGDEELRTQAEELLASDRAEGPLDTPALEVLGGAARSAAALAGRRIGPYRILREIGKGGMGAAYLARRDDEHYRQEVAIKLLRRGADSAYIDGRFRQERQILASLQHPNIARLLDGGVTEEGWPYCVMEYVEGRPIDRYCREQGLSVEDRLRLFETACAAVHHAHRNLVVHCDLKPSNILVTPEGVPKLLDFGIAKLLDPELPGTTAALPTVGPRMMTPEYASPEQVSGRAITTASDVYSLGVVLYELLAGRRPYDFASRTQREIEKVVCEEHPSRPSTLATLSAGEASRDSPERLRRRLRGDLDNIVLMALRKEPERRYGSVEQLAEDLRRHRERQPVLAAPDTLSYRAGKFFRRHRLGVAAAFLLFSSSVSIALLTEEIRWERALTRQVLTLMQDTFRVSDPFGPSGRGELTPGKILENGLRSVRKLDLPPEELANILDVMGVAYGNSSDFETATRLLEEALEIRERHHGTEHLQVAESLENLGMVGWLEGDWKRAEVFVRRALEQRRRLGAGPGELAESLSDLGLILLDRGRAEEAERTFREALEHQHRLSSRGSLETSNYLNNLGLALWKLQRLEEARDRHLEALEMRERLWPDGHPLIADSLNNLALVESNLEHYEKARDYNTRALEIYRKTLGERHKSFAVSLHNLGAALQALKRYEEAEASFRKALEIQRNILEAAHPEIATTIYSLAGLKYFQENFERAAELAEEALALRRKSLPADHPDIEANLLGLGAIYEELGKTAEVAAFKAEAERILARRKDPRDGQ